MIKRFTDLNCWKRSLDLTEIVYLATNDLKDFGLKDQLRRAAISSMNNIAEGFGRKSRSEFRRFLEYSATSCLEIESMTFFLERIPLISTADILKIREVAIETYKMTTGLAKNIESRMDKPALERY